MPPANVTAKATPPISISPTFSERFMRRLEGKLRKIRLGGRAKLRDAANRAFSMPPCGQLPLECDDVEWPVEPNPPREPDVLVDVLRELDGLL